VPQAPAITCKFNKDSVATHAGQLPRAGLPRAITRMLAARLITEVELARIASDIVSVVIVVIVRLVN